MYSRELTLHDDVSNSGIAITYMYVFHAIAHIFLRSSFQNPCRLNTACRACVVLLVCVSPVIQADLAIVAIAIFWCQTCSTFLVEFPITIAAATPKVAKPVFVDL